MHHSACDDQTVLTAQGENGQIISSCTLPSIFSRKSTWIGLGLVAAAAGALLYRARWEKDRVEEQVKATLPFQI
ncbi:MAG TPA: hypothetical protein VNX25_02410 [Verrucomicrobiae bacterium]|nr:hypothetical protein [Verrucomicrobiae bacterium]